MKRTATALLLLIITGTANAWNPFPQVTDYSSDMLKKAEAAKPGDPEILQNIGKAIENGANVEWLTINSESSSFDNVPVERWRKGVPKLVRHVHEDKSLHYRLPTECIYQNGYESIIYDSENPNHFFADGAVMDDATCTNAAEVVTLLKGTSLRFDSLDAWAAHWARMNDAVRTIPDAIGSAWDGVARWSNRNPIAIIALIIAAGAVGFRVYRKRKGATTK